MLFATLIFLASASDPTVTFDVKKGGDVKWKSTSCTVDVTDLEGSSVQAGFKAEEGVRIAAGKYIALVTCESDEGPVKKSVALTVRDDDMSVPVSVDPGFLLVNVLRFDTPVRAEITAFDEHNMEIARSKEKAVIVVPQGKVRLLAKVDPSSFVGGGPRPVYATGTANVVARQKTSVTIDSTDGELTVTLNDNGKKAGGVAALRAPGQKTRLVEIRAGEKASVPPGSYDLVTQLDDTHDFSEVITKDVLITPKKHTQKSVAHRTGSIKPLVLVHGKSPPADAKIEIELAIPGAGAPFNTVAVGDVIKMAAGSVELTAKQSDAPLDDGTNPTAKAKVSVAAGAQKSVTLDLTWGTLDVVTQLGGKPRALDVEVYVQGGDTPAAKKATSAVDGKASFSLAAGKYLVKGVLRAPQGDVVVQQTLSLALGARLTSKLNVDVGTAMVQVFEAGVAVPAEVRFFDKLKDGKPVGEPVLSVPSGQEAFLPPGIYALFVRRKGEEKSFSDIKVAAGRLVERTVDVSPPAPAPAVAPAPAPAPAAPAPAPAPKAKPVEAKATK